jgi:spore coat protein CotH
MRHACRVAVLLACAVLYATPGAHARQSASLSLFDDTLLHEVRLLVHSRDYQQLRAGYLTNTYYPADLVWGTTRVRNVGVRSRGGGSRNPNKLGLRVDMDRYTKNQRLEGLRSLVLDNSWQDPSSMRESLAMSVFRRAGQPAPRESYCRLYINNVYQGLYLIVEPIDGAFASRAFSDANGFLYEYEWVSAFYGEYLGDGFDGYKARFKPQTRELEADATLYGPLRDMFREINAEDDPVWRERVEARLDLAQYVTQAAIEAFLGENDALLGYAGMNNFYLYRGATSTRFRVLPWDRDFAFTFAESSVLRSTDENIPLARALAYPDLRALFLDTLVAVADLVEADDWLALEIERRAALISAAMREDTRKQFGNDDFDAALDFLRGFAAERPARVRAEVATLR